MGLAQDLGDYIGMGAVLEGLAHFAFVDLGELVGLVAGEPVAAVAEQVVAHLAVFEHVEGKGEIAQAQDPRDVDAAGGLVPFGQADVPGGRPFDAEDALHLFVKAALDGLDEFGGLVEFVDGFHVDIEILGSGDAATQRMDLGAGEAEQAVEHHGVQRGGEPLELGAGLEQQAAFFVRADDVDAHVALVGLEDGGPVALEDIEPVEVDGLEGVGLDGLDDDVVGSVCGEAEVADAALALPGQGLIEAPHRVLETLLVVDPVE